MPVDLCSSQHSLVHISVGDLLRAEVAAGTDAGTRAKKFMNNGQLVPNEACPAAHARGSPLPHFVP